MVFEGQRRDRGAKRSVRAKMVQHGAMTDMDAIKDADRQQKIDVGLIIVEAADDLHRLNGGAA